MPTTEPRLAAFDSALSAIGFEIGEVVARDTLRGLTVTLMLPRQTDGLDDRVVRGGQLAVSSMFLDPAHGPAIAHMLMRRVIRSIDLLGAYIRTHVRGSDLHLTMNVGDGGIARLLSFDRPAGDRRPLMPDLYLLVAAQSRTPRTWSEFRSDYAGRVSKLFWRGSTTGGALSTSRAQLLNSPRVRACRLIGRLPRRRADCRVSRIVQASGFNLRLAALELRIRGLMADPVPESAFASYQMTIDLPGNTAAWGACHKYLVGCLVLRPPQPYELIYSHRLQAWTHYIPVSEGLADVEERLDWVASHPDQAAEIAWQGRECLAGVVADLPSTIAEIFERQTRLA